MRESVRHLFWKSLTLYVLMKAGLPVGTKRKRKDGIYEKQLNGKWLKVKEKEDKKEEEKSVATKEEMKNLENEITSELNVPSENLYIHSTTLDGIDDLLTGNKGDYLSASTLDGSSKFLEKFGEGTIFFALNTPKEDVRFHAPGDVGWEGGQPKDTTYDEAGLNDWKVSGIVIPPYLKENENAIAMALIAKQQIQEMSNYETSLSIVGVDNELINKMDKEVDDFMMSFPEDMEYSDVLDLAKEKYSY